ncbi:hypothetical protein ACMDCR_02725 [Labrys okinawensis]|uniref:hypothetical protein n=1 Tax=Labrys okinawensis TaxID=346911 RepID=UPI0039BCFD83
MRPNTLSEVASRLATETLDKVLPEFLDEFYAAESNRRRYLMLVEQPGRTGNLRHDALDCRDRPLSGPSLQAKSSTDLVECP